MDHHVYPLRIEGKALQRATDDVKELLLLLRLIFQPGLHEFGPDAGMQHLNGVHQRSKGLIAQICLLLATSSFLIKTVPLWHVPLGVVSPVRCGCPSIGLRALSPMPPA